MKPDYIDNMRASLLTLTMSAAVLAGETSDSRALDSERRRIMARVQSWVRSLRAIVLNRHPELSELVAGEAVEVLAKRLPTGAGAIDVARAWAYAEDILFRFNRSTWSTPFPGVRLAYMYRDVAQGRVEVLAPC